MNDHLMLYQVMFQPSKVVEVPNFESDDSMDGTKVPIFLECPGLYFLQLCKPCGVKNVVHFHGAVTIDVFG